MRRSCNVELVAWAGGFSGAMRAMLDEERQEPNGSEIDERPKIAELEPYA